ncbi:hypothetical protein JX266_008907 [Neoarthrinium moseri]|nr:hypothetical protein JX266_008907 [Neoarthrinium moseri]
MLDNVERDIDKALNRKVDFKFPCIDASRQVRLLRCSSSAATGLVYTLEVVPLERLHRKHYRALSYIWGSCHTTSDARQILIDGQEFYVRRNLHDFLAAARSRREGGLFFIDAICINQLDVEERQCQIREMTRVYRCADEVISWLGVPGRAQSSNLRALSRAKMHDSVNWTAEQRAGFKYLSYHQYWRRVWVVQEVLLASHVTIWCGSSSFPLNLFGGQPNPFHGATSNCSYYGRPTAVSKVLPRLQSPASKIITHRLRYVPSPLLCPLGHGTKVDTMESLLRDLRVPITSINIYQSHLPDLLYQLIRIFGSLECTDPRDKVYGFLGILNERSRAMIMPDYGKDIKHAYYQALKVGLQEMYDEIGLSAFFTSVDEQPAVYRYHEHLRDVFEIEHDEALAMLRQVLGELNLYNRLMEDFLELELLEQLSWKGTKVKFLPGIDIYELASRGEPAVPSGLLFRYHERQQRCISKL